MSSKFSETHPYIFSVFCDSYKKFIIPPFQRAYAWGSKQINDLWDSICSNEKEYFIGNIVCLEASEDSDDRLTIIDGQQRLFTIFLLLIALRNEFSCVNTKEKNEKERIRKSKDNINRLLLHQEKVHPFKESLRLLPEKENLREIYEKLVSDKLDVDDKEEVNKLDDNQIKYVKNYKTIRRLIKQFIKSDSFKSLDELFERVTSLLFIVIICKSDNDAYDIFEGLNATGIGLSVADLVKNSVMQAVKGKNAKISIEETWDLLEGIFEETRIALFPKFLRHQWISREGYISNNRLFSAIKQQKLRGKESSEIIDFTNELLNDAKLYSALREEQKESYLRKFKKINDDIIEIAKRFRWLDIDQVYELLLAYFNKFININNYTEKQFSQDLEKLWTFSFRSKIISINPSEYEKKFAEQCQHINNYSKKEMDRMSQGFFRGLGKLVDKDVEFKDNFVTDLKYKYGKDNSLIEYLLDAIIRNDVPSIKIASPTIEHILPRDPSKWGLKAEQIKDYVDDIGNLTLLYEKDNKNLGNEKMEIKVKKVYSKSPFPLNKELSKMQKDFENNPKDSIEKRGYKLADFANRTWRI